MNIAQFAWIVPMCIAIHLLIGKQYKVDTAFQAHIVNAIKALLWIVIAIVLMYRFS